MSSKLPPALIRSLIKEFNIEEEDFVKAHEESNRATSIRLNPYKETTVFQHATPIPWCSTGRYLDERPAFTADPLFHAGCYYVQEASSMFLEHILNHATDLTQDLKVVDLCAAPGGKSTLISSLITEDSLLLANEIIKTRVPVLSDNLNRWGRENSYISNNDPADFKKLGAYFDVMVVDAPCSGSGMFRKDVQAIDEWSESAVQLCSQRQQRILADAYPALNEGGILVYSTCSYSKEENEDICDWLQDTFDMTSVQVPLNPEWGIEETRSEKSAAYGYRFYPHKVEGEGFFVACFKKSEETNEPAIRRGKDDKINPSNLAILQKWISNAGNLQIREFMDEYFLIREVHAADFQYLKAKLYLKKTGVRLGKIMGKDLVPNHELAVSLQLSTAIPRVELTREQAIAYLKRDEPKIDTEGQIGWALMCYQNQPLGWAKLLANRINNYFPKEIRIVNQSIS